MCKVQFFEALEVGYIWGIFSKCHIPDSLPDFEPWSKLLTYQISLQLNTTDFLSSVVLKNTVILPTNFDVISKKTPWERGKKYLP